MNFPQRFFGHLSTITKHRWLVFRHCVKAGIVRQGLTHDLSKYSPTEFWQGVKYFQGWRSPNVGERNAEGVSRAWLHHKGRNRHHYEYWYDFIPELKTYGPVPIPMRYIVEMFCDRVAACKVYQKDAYRDDSALVYYQTRRDCDEMHEYSRTVLEKLLRMLAEKGEDETFAYIRTLDLKTKYWTEEK